MPEQFAKYIAATVAHEIGHGLGLVDPNWLEAIEEGPKKLHNMERTRVKLMDAGGLFYVRHRLNSSSTQYWKSDNLRYIRFVLPKE